MPLFKILRFVFVAAAAVYVSAPAKRTPEEMVDYHRQVARNAKALNKCLETRELKELGSRVVAKRQESFHYLRKARGINVKPRDKPALEKWHAINHDKTAEGKGDDFKNDEKLFGYKKADNVPASSCILTPEVTRGPFYTDREAYRQDIRAGQQGIYHRFALQVIDISSCKPLEGARVDIWQTNATGSYAKVVRENKGELNAHWLTGAQATTNWGLVDFDTIFPGNYGGRCVHTHVAVRPTEKLNDPDGFMHVGQIFYDEYPREIINRYDPYTNNPNGVVHNLDDYYTPNASTRDYDSFAQWAWLDDNNYRAGLVTWITIGVDPQYHHDHRGLW